MKLKKQTLRARMTEMMPKEIALGMKKVVRKKTSLMKKTILVTKNLINLKITRLLKGHLRRIRLLLLKEILIQRLTNTFRYL